MSQTKRSKKARRGDRSFQPSAAGKGAQDRTSDVEAYRANYDEIAWGPNHTSADIKKMVNIIEKTLEAAKWQFDWSAGQ